MTYTILNYIQMIKDPRTDYYLKALKESVDCNSIVLDLGAGTGIFSFAALEYGAKKVYAVDNNPYVETIKEIALENNYGDRLIVINQDIKQVALSEKANILVFDIRGKLPLHENCLELIKYTTSHLLENSHQIIPKEDRIYCALANHNPIKEFEFSFPAQNHSTLNKYLHNYIFSAKIKKEYLTSKQELFCTINYANIEKYSFSKTLRFSNIEGKISGFFLWFESSLNDSITFSCGYPSNIEIYGSVFLSLSEEIVLNNHDELSIELSAKYINQSYIWSWNTYLNGEKKFHQSSFYSQSFNPNTTLS